MDTLLILESFSLVVNLFGVLVFLAMSWLYFDAIALRKQTNVWLSAIGSLVMALGFVLAIVNYLGIEKNVFALGFLLLAFGSWTKPMSKRPEKSLPAVFWGGFGGVGAIFAVLAALATALGYFRLVSLGMERHLKRLGWGMYILSLSFLFGLRSLFVTWFDSRLVRIVNDYQFFWVLEKATLALGLCLIGSWVFSYLLKRFETQLSLFLGGIVILVFGSSVVLYSFVIAFGYQRLMISQAEETLKMTRHFIDVKLVSMLGQTKMLANSQRQIDMLKAQDGERAKKEVEELSRIETLSKIQVLDNNLASVLTWGGESVEIASLGFVKDLQAKKHATDIVIMDKNMYLVSGSLIESDGENLGYVVVTRQVDSAFLSSVGYKSSEILLWIMDDLKAKTSTSDDNLRLGMKDVSGHTEKTKEKRDLMSTTNWQIGGKNYFGSSQPLFDSRGSVVGVLSSYRSVSSVWQEITSRLTESYRMAVALLLVMVLPSYLMARKLRSEIG